MISPHELPPPRKLTERRVLPVWNGSSFDPMFVDDRGTCSVEQHPVTGGGFTEPRMHHRYREADGKKRFYAIRCPASLTESEELSTISDNPPGSCHAVLLERANERRGSKSKRHEEGE